MSESATQYSQSQKPTTPPVIATKRQIELEEGECLLEQVEIVEKSGQGTNEYVLNMLCGNNFLICQKIFGSL